MKNKKNYHQIFFIILSLIFSVLSESNDLPSEWSTQEMQNYINTNYKGKTFFFMDPYKKIESEEEINKIDLILNQIQSYNVYTFFIVVPKTSESSFDIYQVIDNYTFTEPSSKSNSLFILHKYESKKYFIIPGDNLKSKYTTDYIKYIIDQVDPSSPYSKFDYSAVRKILSEVRNVFVVPENFWTAQDLISYYEKTLTPSEQKYLYFDPSFQGDVFTKEENEKYFIDLYNKGVSVYFFIINRMNDQYSLNISVFLNELSQLLTLPTTVDKKNTIIILYVPTLGQKIDLYIGDNLLFLGQEELNMIKEDGETFSFVPKSVKQTLLDLRFFYAGEYLGWDAKMFYDHLTSFEVLKYEYNFYFKDRLNFTQISSNLIDDRLIDLSKNKFCLYIFFVFKIDPKYNKKLEDFHSDLKKYFTPKCEEDSSGYYYLSILDGNITFTSFGKM